MRHRGLKGDSLARQCNRQLKRRGLDELALTTLSAYAQVAELALKYPVLNLCSVGYDDVRRTPHPSGRCPWAVAHGYLPTGLTPPQVPARTLPSSSDSSRNSSRGCARGPWPRPRRRRKTRPCRMTPWTRASTDLSTRASTCSTRSPLMLLSRTTPWSSPRASPLCGPTRPPSRGAVK